MDSSELAITEEGWQDAKYYFEKNLENSEFGKFLDRDIPLLSICQILPTAQV